MTPPLLAIDPGGSGCIVWNYGAEITLTALSSTRMSLR